METIEAAEFETKCLQLMDEVSRTGSPLTITKDGVAVAQLVAAGNRARTLIGLHKGQITVHGNIDEPVAQELGTGG